MITVVIPTIGRNQTFGRAFDSVKKIDKRLVSRIVIIDNSQSPLFQSYLNELILRSDDSRVIVFSKPERVSMANSWNSALNSVRTDWVLFLHDDDELLDITPSIATITELLNKYSNVGFVAFDFQCQYYSRIAKKIKRVTRSWRKPINAESLIYECPKLVSTIINVEQLKKINGFSDAYGNFLDFIVFLEIYKSADALFVQIPIGVYHLHDDNESAVSKRHIGYGNYIPNVCKKVFDLYEDTQFRMKFIKATLDFVYQPHRNGVSGLINRVLESFRANRHRY
jgi:glycosyltransferase involved in cell wall biosynthesis